MDQFLLFGDSITQQAFSQEIPASETRECGFLGPALSDVYVRRLDIINRGLSGYNTRQALKVLPQVIPTPEVARLRFLTIFFGANDARLPNTPPNPQQHVPAQEFKENLRAIATHPTIKAHKDVRIILITPPPIDERKSLAAEASSAPEDEPTLRRKAVVTARYAQLVRDLGKELDLAVLDLWTIVMGRAGHSDADFSNASIPGSLDSEQSPELQRFVHDGLHLTREAYELWYHELMKLIEDVWPDQMPEKLDYALPRWDDREAWKGEGNAVL